MNIMLLVAKKKILSVKSVLVMVGKQYVFNFFLSNEIVEC